VYNMSQSGDGATDVTAWAADGTVAFAYNIAANGLQFTLTTNTWYVLGFAVTPSNVVFLKDMAITGSYLGTWDEPTYLWLGQFNTGQPAANIKDIDYDWVRIRKYSYPEPTANTGSEQQTPFPAIFAATTVCLGDTTQFTDLSAGSSVSWIWDFGDGDSAALQNPMHLYNTPGNYTVQLTVADVNGCQVTATMGITVNPEPSIAAIIGSGNVKPNEILIYAVSFTANSKYTWIINGGAQVSGSNSNSIYVLWGTAGLGRVCVIETNSFGCAGDTVCLDVTIASPTAIDELVNSNNSIEVYPNPAYEYLNIELNSNLPQLVSIKFYDIRGSLIKEMSTEVLSKKPHELDISGWFPGIYYIKIQTDQWVITKKVAVIRP